MNLLLPTVLIVLGGCVPPAALGPPPPTIGGSAPQGGMVTGRLHDVTPSQPSIDGWWVDGELWTDMVAGPLVLRPVVGFGYRDYGGGYQQSPLGGVMGADAWLPVTRGRLSVGLMAGAGVLYGRGGVFGQYQADAWRLALIGYGSGSVLFELGLLLTPEQSGRPNRQAARFRPSYGGASVAVVVGLHLLRPQRRDFGRSG